MFPERVEELDRVCVVSLSHQPADSSSFRVRGKDALPGWTATLVSSNIGSVIFHSTTAKKEACSCGVMTGIYNLSTGSRSRKTPRRTKSKAKRKKTSNNDKTKKPHCSSKPSLLLDKLLFYIQQSPRCPLKLSYPEYVLAVLKGEKKRIHEEKNDLNVKNSFSEG